MIVVYGLKNCDSCRKALKWLAAEGLTARLVDVRAEPPTRETVAAWCRAVGWETLLNRRGTTWRGLDDAAKAEVDESRAIDLIVAHPALMKRPLIENGGRVTVGFDARVQASLGH
ncbi:arsenate reductase [Oceanibacterium hippocampi]|uniref:Regulatory protein Spx n=1 Tax=Oceanibacterium hippocampi TaxID=745714 RepID=A0A1Y5T507_9PROT|nr:arsenate reductase [Oceanibacterium hippocampi]SLN56008.1 Regulatory protein Spx [Oceanibacterium hippocampi]